MSSLLEKFAGKINLIYIDQSFAAGAVDFNFQNGTFNNGWTSYRTKKDRTLNLKAGPHNYENTGQYKVFVKVIDMVGIDTSQIFEIQV